MSGYIARLIARDVGLSDDGRRAAYTPPLQPRAEGEPVAAMVDPFEAAEEQAVDTMPTLQPNRQEPHPPTPSALRREGEKSPTEFIETDDGRSDFVPSAAPIIQREVVLPPPPTPLPEFRDGESSARLGVEDLSDAAPIHAYEPEQAQSLTPSFEPENIAAPAEPPPMLDSPWTFEDLLAPFLKGIRDDLAAREDDSALRDEQREAYTPPLQPPIETQNPPRQAWLPVIEPEAPLVEPITPADTPSIIVGDIVIEVTPPRPPVPTPRRSAPAAPAPPRQGVRSKRGFGIGQS